MQMHSRFPKIHPRPWNAELQLDLDRTEHPVDIIERIAAHNHWSFDRDEQDEISISVSGGWTDYNIAFTWLADVEALHVACAFDLKVPRCV